MQRRVRRFALGCSLALTGAWLGWSASPAQAADGEDATIALARDLELIVAETGPEQPWTIHLHNRGSAPIAIMADPGLLWFEVAVPGVPAPRVCRLPEPLWPTAMRRRAELVLQPGERFSRRFDPRFFCFSDVVQTTLVPGAKVTPHFGWPQEQRATTVKGKAQRLDVIFGANYKVAVVWAPKPPAGQERNFICFEPMVGVTNAVNMAQKGTYTGLQSIAPGATWKESFWIKPSGFEAAAPAAK